MARRTRVPPRPPTPPLPPWRPPAPPPVSPPPPITSPSPSPAPPMAGEGVFTLQPGDTSRVATIGAVSVRCTVWSSSAAAAMCLWPQYEIAGSFHLFYSSYRCGSLAPELFCYVATGGDRRLDRWNSLLQQDAPTPAWAQRRWTAGGGGQASCQEAPTDEYFTLAAGGITVSGKSHATFSAPNRAYYDTVACFWRATEPPSPPLPLSPHPPPPSSPLPSSPPEPSCELTPSQARDRCACRWDWRGVDAPLLQPRASVLYCEET